MFKRFRFTAVFILALVPAVMCAFPAPAAETGNEGDDLVAVAYTGENYTGASWKIYAAGDYDLWGGFGLPNDSVCSIRVRPGYKVSIYEHSEFGGHEFATLEDTPSLDEFWKRQASSLRVREDDSPGDSGAETWLESIEDDATSFASTRLNSEAREAVVKKSSESLGKFIDSGESDWYGYDDSGEARSDEERVRMGGELLEIFKSLGYDTEEWTANSFAQQINNIYDWLKTPWSEHDLGPIAGQIIDGGGEASPGRSIWRVSCFVMNVSPFPAILTLSGSGGN
jgi:hypothetical protein